MDMNRKSVFVITAVAVTVLALAMPSALSSNPQFPAPGPKRKIVLGMPVIPPNVVHTPMALAKELGLMDKFNIDLEIMNFEGSTRALTAAIVGAVHVGTLDCLQAFGNGVPLVGLWGGAPKLGVAMVVRDSIKDVKDLKGKKIGMSSAPGGFIDRMNRAVLASAGLRPEDVTIVQTTTAGRVPALLSGMTDTAIFHYEQTSMVLRTISGYRVLYDLQNALPNYQYHIYCGTRTFVLQNREAVTDMVAASILAVRHAYKNRADTVKALARITGAEEMDAGYACAKIITGCVWAQNLGLDRGRLSWSIDYGVANGEMRNKYRPEELLNMGIANEALKRAGGPIQVPAGCF